MHKGKKAVKIEIICEFELKKIKESTPCYALLRDLEL